MNSVLKGAEAEAIACSWLRERGFKIVERNFRHNHLEVDIIAVGPLYDPGVKSLSTPVLHIIEVRGREAKFESDVPGEMERAIIDPALTVDEKKQKHLIDAASFYARSHKLDLELVFDIISVEFLESGSRLSFIPNAFRAEW
ncbi:MAG: YraN family protein [Bacteroidales bacterium]|nr:YraN family protein [Bacteroidales bacterium]